MTPCFFLQCYESPQIEQCLAAFRTAGLSVQTYSFSANETGGVTGCTPSLQTVGGGLPPAMLACPESEHFSDCRLQWILGTVLFITCEPQSVQARVFAFSANSKVTIQIVNSCGESSLRCHSLTLSPRCPVGRSVPAARVNSPPRVRAGTNRATVAGLSFPCQA